MRRGVLLIALLTLTLALPGLLLAQAPDTITITGSVINATSGGTVPQQAPVRVQFFNEGTWTAIYTTTLSAEHTFVFEAVAPEGGAHFVTRIEYAGVAYFSEPAPATDTDKVELTIFEPTHDASGVQIDQAHLFIMPLDDRIYITEYYLLGNTSDRAYTGDSDGVTVHFSLPEGAASLSFEGPGLGERYVGNATRFADTRAIPPGTATIEVNFRYELPYLAGQSIERVFEHPLQSLALVVNSEHYGLEGEGLVTTGSMDTQMGPAISYSAGPLAAGEPVAFTLVPRTETEQSAAPATASPPRQRHATRELGMGIVALAVAGIVAYVLWQPPAPPPMPAEARPIVEQIAALDARFASREVAEAVYHQQRERLKHRLQVMLRQSRGTDTAHP